MTAGEAMDHNWFLPSQGLSNSGKSSSRTNAKGDETEKTKMRETLNHLIDAERKDQSPLEGINLDAEENPYWRSKRERRKGCNQ